MHLTDQQFTVMNVMELPMILGISIDDGVQIVHRWLREGKGKIHRLKKNQIYDIMARNLKEICFTFFVTGPASFFSLTYFSVAFLANFKYILLHFCNFGH